MKTLFCSQLHDLVEEIDNLPLGDFPKSDKLIGKFMRNWSLTYTDTICAIQVYRKATYNEN